jgi:hypothetical protein
MKMLNKRIRNKINSKTRIMMLYIFIICLNLTIIRDVRHFSRDDLVVLFLLDVFLPLVAFLCGFANLRFIRFIIILIFFDIVCLALGVISILSSF